MYTVYENDSHNIVQRKRNTRALQTPGDVLNFWFADVATNPSILEERTLFWWKGSDEADRTVATRSVALLARLASGLGEIWADKGPAERLAAIVALDQFSRNIFRGTPFAFENDALALRLCKEGLANGEDIVLSPIKRYFMYMPLMHSEDLGDQNKCVELFEDLVAEADDTFKPSMESALQYAIAHRDIIKKYGRFPHRNSALERPSTDVELAYLAKPGAGF